MYFNLISCPLLTRDCAEKDRISKLGEKGESNMRDA